MEKGLAGILAIVSLGLPVGWQWVNNSPWLAKWSKRQWIGYTAEFFYFVGLPYVALVFGVLPPQWLGLKGLEYFSLISSGALAADLQRVFTLILVEGLVDAGWIAGMGLLAVLFLGGIICLLARYGITEAHSSKTILGTLYYTLHWAFYWALFWLIMDDAYLGILMGSGWVILEWFLVARLQKSRFGRQPSQLVEVMILILTATIFFYRPNLWLLWPVHLALVVLTRLIQAKITGPVSADLSAG